MLKSLLGKKLGMMQLFSEDGNAMPVTVVEAGPCTVVQKKTLERDGYQALQLGFEELNTTKRVNKPVSGHFNKTGVAPTRYLKELRVDDADQYEEGQVVKAEEIFKSGDFVDVTGISKGKGFTGVMKRHGFAGAPGSHGAHETFRGPGSIGAAAYPARVFKGTKLPGRMGGEKVTVQNLKVVQVLGALNLILINGAVPGARGGFLMIKKGVKKGEQETGKE